MSRAVGKHRPKHNTKLEYCESGKHLMIPANRHYHPNGTYTCAKCFDRRQDRETQRDIREFERRNPMRKLDDNETP